MTPTLKRNIIDAVGLYLNPPGQAIVLCMDEKSSIQALDRMYPSLPMKKGGGGATMTHHYKRTPNSQPKLRRTISMDRCRARQYGPFRRR